MVKINKTLGLALLTALAASCSSDNDVAQSNNPVIENGDVAYATLRIDLPTQQGSRATTFADGLASEYKVNDATLLVFKKGSATSEGAYTFLQSVDLGTLTPTAVGYNGITTQAEVTAKLDKASLTDAKKGEYYGLVILNNKKKNGSVKINVPTTTVTYSAWNVADNVIAANMTDVDNGIVMANAPEWTTSGQAPLTLVAIDGTKVQPTEAQAKAAGTAATIHVERGLAKVTMATVEKAKETPTGTAFASDNVTISKWGLDVTNTKSYPVHNVDGLATDYSAIWTESTSATTAPTVVNRFHDMTNTFKRVFWGKDPNYSLGADYITGADAVNKCEKEFNMVKDATKLSDKFSTDNANPNNPQYCLENTFDINNMTQGQTTRVLIQATYAPSGITSGTTFFRLGNKMYIQKDLEAYINNVVKLVAGKTSGTDYTLSLGDIATKAGSHELSADNFKKTEGTDNADLGDGMLDKVKAQLNGKIQTYVNGVCYYIGRIKHFNAETPWNAGDATYGTGDDANLKYLGRYGVLRNNWYQLSVNSITGPGEPDIPTVVPENPDDESNVYVDLSVKILQWAVRSQGLDL